MQWCDKHKEFWKAGKRYAHRIIDGDNRVGKTKTVCQELSYHLTGNYPEDWEGRVFNIAIKAWAITPTRDQYQHTIVDGLQDLLKDKIIRQIKVAGSQFISEFHIEHQSNFLSKIRFISIQEGGLDQFYGEQQNFIWLDDCGGRYDYQQIKNEIKSRLLSSSNSSYVETYTDRNVWSSKITWGDVLHLDKKLVEEFRRYFDEY